MRFRRSPSRFLSFRKAAWLTLSAIFAPMALSAADATFVGIWKPDVEATLERARNNPDFKEEELPKHRMALSTIAGSMRMEITKDTFTIRFGTRNKEIAPYRVISRSEDQMLIEVTPPKEDPVEATLKHTGEGRIMLSVDGSNDMDHLVWEPAESMDGEDPNLAALATAIAAMGGEVSDKKPDAPEKEKTIEDNLRVIATNAEYYMMEHGATSATYGDLVGEYFEPLPSINGEDYSTLVVSAGDKTVSVTDKDGVVHTVEL